MTMTIQQQRTVAERVLGSQLTGREEATTARKQRQVGTIPSRRFYYDLVQPERAKYIPGTTVVGHPNNAWCNERKLANIECLVLGRYVTINDGYVNYGLELLVLEGEKKGKILHTNAFQGRCHNEPL